jgi:hypothetical protein
VNGSASAFKLGTFMPQFLPGGLRDQRQGSSRESRLTNDHANDSNESAGKSDHVISKKQLWTGCILSGLAALFFLYGRHNEALETGYRCASDRTT